MPSDTTKTRHRKLYGLTLTRFMTKYRSIYRQIWELRTQLSEAVEATHGGISLEQAANINLACRFEGHVKVIEHQVEKGLLEPREIPAALQVAAALTEKRNRAIKQLNLPEPKTKGASAWDEVDEIRETEGEPEAERTADDVGSTTASEPEDG